MMRPKLTERKALYGPSPVDKDLLEDLFESNVYVDFDPSIYSLKNKYMITKKNSTAYGISLLVAFVLGWVFLISADNYSAGYSTFAYIATIVCFGYFVISVVVWFATSGKKG